MTINRKFDRIASFDERSRAYPIRALIPVTYAPRSYTWSCGVWLDQGSEGACTGFSMAQEAAARPAVVQGITNTVAREIYQRAKQLDQWMGEDYDGSSVLGAAKAGKERGWYTEYRWAFGEEDLRLAIGYKGPAVIGIYWLEGMMEPDSQNLIHATGATLGGHAILCNGVSIKRQVYRLHNSWGRSWGLNGECFISFADMDRMLRADGEVMVPVIRKLP